MTVKDMTRDYATARGISLSSARGEIDTFAAVLAKRCEGDRETKVPRLGTFKPYTRKARNARNPATGETVRVDARRDVKFKAAADLKG